MHLGYYSFPDFEKLVTQFMEIFMDEITSLRIKNLDNLDSF